MTVQLNVITIDLVQSHGLQFEMIPSLLANLGAFQLLIRLQGYVFIMFMQAIIIIIDKKVTILSRVVEAADLKQQKSFCKHEHIH